MWKIIWIKGKNIFFLLAEGSHQCSKRPYLKLKHFFNQKKKIYNHRCLGFGLYWNNNIIQQYLKLALCAEGLFLTKATDSHLLTTLWNLFIPKNQQGPSETIPAEDFFLIFSGIGLYWLYQHMRIFHHRDLIALVMLISLQLVVRSAYYGKQKPKG